MSRLKEIRDRYYALCALKSTERTEADATEIRDLINLVQSYDDQITIRDNFRCLGLLEDWLVWAGVEGRAACHLDPKFVSLANRTWNYMMGSSTSHTPKL